MKDKICYVVCAGENKGFVIKKTPNNYVIAADGGLKYLQAIGVAPDLIVGDFDSTSKPNCDCEIIKLEIDKAETDTFVCIQEGLKRGYDTFYLYCATGGRIDHTIANLQTLIFIAKQGARGYLFDGEQVITVISQNNSISFNSNATGGISVFALNGNTNGVSIAGLKYTLNNSVLSEDFPLGVSNSFIAQSSKIECKEGYLAVVFPTTEIKNLV
ncbi:MAG: thiamine diphosphokinase [Clostridiales bacterium]|nr:thiamine diphosphokinase [Clostridiales bacterium]